MSCLIDFILYTDQSFSLLENKNFISFVRGLNKNFKIPSRKTFCDSILHSKVNNLNHHVFIVKIVLNYYQKVDELKELIQKELKQR